jgi:D-alanine-D-alanine ligase
MHSKMMARNEIEIKEIIALRLRKISTLLIEGDHSFEDRIYKYHPHKPARSIASVINALSNLGIAFNIIKSTDPNLVERCKEVDFIFICAEGEFCEDGRLQGLLDFIGTPYLGCGALASALCADKLTFKRICRAEGIPTPAFHSLDREADIKDIRLPTMLKYRFGGSSMRLLKETTQKGIEDWIILHNNDRHLYFTEDWVDGRSLSFALFRSRGQLLHLPPLEIIGDSGYYSESDKLGISTARYIPGPSLPSSVFDKMEEYACRAFLVSNCEAFARFDFMVTAENEVFILEANTIPNFGHGGNLAKMFFYANFSHDEMVAEVIRCSLEK